MKLQLPILIAISLLLTAALVMGSYLAVYHHAYEVDMDRLDILSKEYKDGKLTVSLTTTLAGEFLYDVEAAENDDGNFELTFLGGKQPSLAQKPGQKEAVFTVEIPKGYEKVVCGKTVLYTFS